MTLKKLITALAAVVLCFALLPACTSTPSNSNTNDPGNDGGSTDDNGVTLTLFHRYATDDQAAFMEKIVDQFEEETGIHVEVSTSGRDEYRDKLKVVLGSNEIPDVYFCYAYENVYEIIREGKCMDLTSYFEADSDWQNTYMEGVLDGYTYEGALYGVPYRVSISVMLYNKDIYAEHGLEVPETMDELIANCEVLEAAGVQSFVWANSEMWPAPQWIGAFNDQLVDADTLAADYGLTGDFTDQGYIEAFDLLSTLLSYGNEDVNAKTFSLGEESFAAGEAAMMWSESVAVGDIPKLNPDCNFGVFAIPTITNGAGDKTGVQGGPEGFVINPDTAHPEEAIELIKFLSSAEVGEMMMEELQWFNGAAGVVDATAGEDLTPIEQSYVIMDSSTGLLPFLDTAMNSSVANLYIANMQSYIDGSMTAEEVMQSVREEAEFFANE